MPKRNIIRELILIIFILTAITFGVSSIIFSGLDSDGTDIEVLSSMKIIVIVSGSLAGAIGLFYLIYRFALIYKVNKTYDYYVKQNHKYDTALEKFAKYSKLIVPRFIGRYIDLHIAYTYLRVANYDKCIDLFTSLYERNKAHEYFMISFFSLYYLTLISYVKDNTDNISKYISNINLLLEKNQKIILNNKIYASHIEIIKSIEAGNKSRLRELILQQCDGDPNKLKLIKDIYKK